MNVCLLGPSRYINIDNTGFLMWTAWLSGCLVIWVLLFDPRLPLRSSVFEQDPEPLTAPDRLVGTLHASLGYQCVNEWMRDDTVKHFGWIHHSLKPQRSDSLVSMMMPIILAEDVFLSVTYFLPHNLLLSPLISASIIITALHFPFILCDDLSRISSHPYPPSSLHPLLFCNCNPS